MTIFSLLAVGLLASGCRTEQWGCSFPPDTSDPFIVRAGDKLIVTFHRDGEADVSQEMLVKEDGTIVVPLIGQFSVAKKTCEQVATQIKAAILDERPEKPLQVTVKDPSTPVIYIRGEVRNSGRFLCDGEIDLLKAIVAAGDLNEYANRKKLRIIRSNGKEETVTGFLYCTHTKPLIVYPGDQIIVLRK